MYFLLHGTKLQTLRLITDESAKNLSEAASKKIMQDEPSEIAEIKKVPEPNTPDTVWNWLTIELSPTIKILQ